MAGCGNAGKGKLTSAQAAKLTRSVDRAQASFQKGNCADARTAAAAGADKVAGLRSNVDNGLRQNLIDGFNHLEQELATACDTKPETTSTPEPTITETPTEAPTVTVTATPSPDPTHTATATPSPTTTAEPTATATTTPAPDTGGTNFEGGQ